MASQEYKDRLVRAVDKLPDEKAARLVDFAEQLSGRSAKSNRRRPRFDTYRGKLHVPDAFFEPLPDNVIDAFEGKETTR